MASVATRRSRSNEPGYYWPGFVDAMAQLLLVITFLLSVFIIAQFLVARQMSGQDTALAKLRSQIAELAELLALEKSAKADLELSLGTISDDLAAAKNDNSRLQALIDMQTQEGQAAGSTASTLATRARQGEGRFLPRRSPRSRSSTSSWPPCAGSSPP